MLKVSGLCGLLEISGKKESVSYDEVREAG